MINNEEQISRLPHLVEHNYFFPVNKNNCIVIEEEVNQVSASEATVSLNKNQCKNVFGVPKTYTIIPGVRHRSRIYVDNLQFKYYKREIRGNRVYVVCERQKNTSRPFCPCTASVSTDQTNDTITLRTLHNHGPMEIDLNIPFLREEISTVGIDRMGKKASVRTIYNNVIVQNPVASTSYTYHQAQNRVKRMRRLRQLQKSPFSEQQTEDYSIIKMYTNEDKNNNITVEHDKQETKNKLQNKNKILVSLKKLLDQKRKKKETQKSKGDCDIFGELIANKLKRFEYSTRSTLQYQIRTLILNAELNLLHTPSSPSIHNL